MTKMRQWSLLTGLAIVVILVAGWMFIVKPQHTTANSIQAQAASIQQHNSVLANQVASLRARSKDLPAQQAKLAAISVKIPDNPALPALIRALTSAATGAGVDLVTIAPAAPTAVTAAAGGSPGAAATGRTTAAGAPTSPTQPLTEIPVTLTVHGTYFTVEQFFFNLENLPRALRVTQFNLSPGGATNGSAASPTSGSAVEQLTASISAQVYMAPDATTTSTPVPGTK